MTVYEDPIVTFIHQGTIDMLPKQIMSSIENMLHIPSIEKLNEITEKACSTFETIYNRSIIPKTYTIEHNRNNILLIYPRIRKLNKVEVRSGRKWTVLYESIEDRHSYVEENYWPPLQDHVTCYDFNQKFTEYGGRCVVLDESKYGLKTVVRVLYQTGYKDTDVQKIPMPIVWHIVKIAQEIYKNGYYVSEEMGEKLCTVY